MSYYTVECRIVLFIHLLFPHSRVIREDSHTFLWQKKRYGTKEKTDHTVGKPALPLTTWPQMKISILPESLTMSTADLQDDPALISAPSLLR